MNDPRRIGEELFHQRFRQIERIVHAVAARSRLKDEDRQELYSLTMMKIVQDDYAVLRGFQGKSGWGTYLTVVVKRVLLDDRVKKWGRFRPCARVRRLGKTAVRLDRRIHRDGVEPEEAIRELLSCGARESAEELARLVEEIPRRQRRQFVSEAALLALVERDEADLRVEAGERTRLAAHLQNSLASALKDLPTQERDLLEMRFGRGFTVRQIAGCQNVEPRRLYRRFESILRRLRRRLEGAGLAWREVSVVCDRLGRELEIHLL